MTPLTPLPAIALVYFLYVAVTEGFTLVNTALLVVAAVLFLFSLKRPDARAGDRDAPPGIDDPRPGARAGDDDRPPAGP